MNYKKTILLVSPLALTVALFLVSVLSGPSWLVEFKRSYNFSFLEPLEIFSLATLIASIIMLSQSVKKVDVWLKYILSWFLPLSFIIVASGTDGAQFGWMPKTTLAQIMGTLLVIVTLGFVMAQALLPRLQKNKK